jgi:hypothetical protein
MSKVIARNEQIPAHTNFLVNEFAWNYLQDHKDLSIIQDYLYRALKNAPDINFPFHQMTCDLVEIMKSCLECHR